MSNSQTITGKYLGTTAPKKLSNGKISRNFYLDITEKPEYPNTPSFQLYGDKCSIVDVFKKGDEIEVHFNISGRKYKNSEGKEAVFTVLQAWKIEKVESSGMESDPIPEAETGEGDPLPF